MRPCFSRRASIRTAVALTVCAAIHAGSVAATGAAARLGGQNGDQPTVWDGVFTAEQAERGQFQYATSCARCHGGGLEGGMGRALVGTPFWNTWREQSLADLLDYISRSMPMGAQAASLSPGAYADIVAFLLRSNDLPAGSRALTAASATGVRIVPKDGGNGELPATTLARVVGCLAPRGPGGEWLVTRASRPERVKAIDGPPGTSPEGNDRQYRLQFVLQPLAPLVGHRVAVVGLLMGDGGSDGINVTTVTSMAPACN